MRKTGLVSKHPYRAMPGPELSSRPHSSFLETQLTSRDQKARGCKSFFFPVLNQLSEVLKVPGDHLRERKLVKFNRFITIYCYLQGCIDSVDIVDLQGYSDTGSSIQAIFTVSLFCAEVSTCSHVSEFDPIYRSQVDLVRYVRALVTGEV